MPLEPGPVPSAQMNIRQWSTWCRDQQINADDDSVSTTTIQDGAVTAVKVQDILADRILGRLSTSGSFEQLSAAQVVDFLEVTEWNFTGTVTFAGAVMFGANVGFYGALAVAQQADIGALTLTTHSGSPNTALADVSGSGDDGTINDNFHEMGLQINNLRTLLRNYGLMA